MRNLAQLILLVVLVSGLSACRYDTRDVRTDQNPVANQPQAITATFTPDATSGDIALTLQQAQADTVVLNVRTNSTQNFFGVTFKMSYNPVVVQFTGYDAGDLFDAGAAPFYAANVVNGIQGSIAVGASLKRGTPMSAGPGNVIRLRFKVVSNGSTALSFSENVLRDDSFNEVVGLKWSSGQITGN